MKKRLIIYMCLFVLLACSRQTVRVSSDPDRRGGGSSKYDYLLSEAIRQKYVGEMGEAIKLYEKCIELDKSRSVPYFELAQIYAAMGLNEKSVKYASTAANIEKDNYWYQLACGSLFVQFNKKDSALVYFKRALKADPEAIEVNTVLAGLYAERGEKEKADSMFMILDNAGALDEQMFLIMIAGLMDEGKNDEAAKRTLTLVEGHPSEMRYKALLADIYNAAGEKEKSDSIYNSIIETDPDNVESQLLVIVNLVNKKEYTAASAFVTSVFKSEAIERDRKVALARELVQDSAYLMAQSNSLELNLLFLEIAYPDDEEVLSIRPLMYEELERWQDAIVRLEEIVQKVMPGYFFKERLIMLYAREEEFEKLYHLASSYAAENNKSILGKVYYAIAAMELKKYDVADSELRKAMILAGNDDQMKLQVLSMMGDLKYRMKDFKASYKYLEEALSIDPEDVMLLNNYSYFLAEDGKELNKALKMAEKVMEKEGNNPTYMDTYAWVLYKLGRNKEAVGIMQELFKNDGERDPEILEHMGYILKALSKCEEAILYWKEAMEEDGSKVYLKEEIKKCSGEKK